VSRYIAKADLELTILLPQPSDYCDYRCEPHAHQGWEGFE
jgi:hypothetical protein